jgi:antitoxin PrlF
MNIDVSKMTSKGQITIPKTIRQRLNLVEGDKVAFIEDDNGKIIITRSSVLALREFLDSMSKESLAKEVTEEELLSDLEQVREEMWNDRKEK